MRVGWGGRERGEPRSAAQHRSRLCSPLHSPALVPLQTHVVACGEVLSFLLATCHHRLLQRSPRKEARHSALARLREDSAVSIVRGFLPRGWAAVQQLACGSVREAGGTSGRTSGRRGERSSLAAPRGVWALRFKCLPRVLPTFIGRVCAALAALAAVSSTGASKRFTLGAPLHRTASFDAHAVCSTKCTTA